MSLPNIKNRVISGVSMAVVLFCVFFLMPDAGLPFVLAALAAVISLEFYKMLSIAGIPNFNRFGTVGIIALVLVTWYTGLYGRSAGGSWDAVVLFVITIVIFLRQFPQKDNDQPLRTISGTLFGLMYIGLLWNFVPKLLLFGRPETVDGIYMTGRWLLLYAVFVAKFTDIGAYLVGCSFGRHKLIPRMSPGKSWEGVGGGIVVGTLAGWILVCILKTPLAAVGLTPLRAIPLGICLSICGVVGDLTESLFKRASGLKDSGGIIPGMGGVLDVLDSLLFTFPALYIYLRLVAVCG